MAIDTSIYGQIRNFRMDDPYEGAAKALQLRQAQKQFRLEDDMAAAGQESGGDPEKMAEILLQRGHHAPALQIRQQVETAKKEKRLAQNADIERELKLAEAVGSDAMMLDSTFRQALQQSGGNRVAAIQAVAPAYGQIRAKWARLGKNLPEQFDPDANFAGIGQAKEAVQYLKTLQPERVQPTELARLQSERDALFKANPEDPRVAQYDRVLAGYKAGRGDTNVTLNAPGPMVPGKTAAGEVDKDILSTTQNLMRLDAISSQFKPEYQTIMTRGNAWWSSVKEKLGADLKVKEKKDLEDFSKYKRNAIDALNRYIKEITGAAMTDAEAERILRGLPNAGTGIFDGDSPTEFKSRLDDAIKQTKVAVARLSYIKRNGMSLMDGQGNPTVALEKMPDLINARGKELEAELGKSGTKGKALERAVRRQLGIEFGLSSD